MVLRPTTGSSAARPRDLAQTAVLERLLAPAGLLSLLLVSLFLGGCSDNISCVLVNGCRMGDGLGGADSAAELPDEGQWIVDGAPLIEESFPNEGVVASTSPIVVRFNESMSLDSLLSAFELIPITNGFEGPAIPLTTGALVGDGRLLVLLPATRLTVGEYFLTVAAGAALRDITGQVADVNVGTQLASFAVDTTDPVDMQLVTTFPADAATNESETGEVVVVFDRPAQETTVTSDSIQVTIGGDDPTSDPDPTPLTIEALGIPLTDLRVFLWRSVTDEGDIDPLPTGGQVLVEVSPTGNEISDETGAVLLPVTFAYQLTPFARPLSAALLSMPEDAIGTANLTAGDAEELLLQIDLEGAETGDFLDLFLFGASLDEEPRTIALSRALELTDPAPIEVAFYGLEDVDLLLSTDPLETRFSEGPVAFAFRLRRGVTGTALTVLDVDPDTDGVQDPVLDTTGPVIESLFFADGGTTSVRSNLRDIVLGGRADEFVRAIEVRDEAFGDNGVLADVIGVDEDGLFVTRPIAAGLLPPGDRTLDVVTFDAAFNASEPFQVTYRQVGVVGPDAYNLGDPVAVEVVDAVTLQPVEGALVLSHADEGDGVTYPLVDSGTTDALGDVTVSTSGAPALEALVTVDAIGYDLFTLHGVGSARLSVLLRPSGSEASATVAGDVTTADPESIFILPLLDRRLGDSRRPEGALPLVEVEDCQIDPFGSGTTNCPFGPEPVRPGRVGVLSFLAGSFLQNEATLEIQVLQQAFDLRFPLEVLGAGDASLAEARVEFLLSGNGVPEEEAPRELLSPGGSMLSLAAGGLAGIDVNDLVGDALTTGDPFVTVEAATPGYPGAVPVGPGLAFEQASGVWNLRAAFPGAVSTTGFFGQNGLVETDLFLRAELRDTAGNRVGARPRVSRLDSLPLTNTLFPVGAAQLSSPAAGGSSGGQAFDLVFEETLVDFYGLPGLYRARIEDEGGRRWDLWRPDPAGALAEDLRIHVPNVGAAGGTGLVNGTLRTSLFTFALPEFDPGAFLWTDIEREHELFSEAAPVSFQKP